MFYSSIGHAEEFCWCSYVCRNIGLTTENWKQQNNNNSINNYHHHHHHYTVFMELQWDQASLYQCSTDQNEEYVDILGQNLSTTCQWVLNTGLQSSLLPGSWWLPGHRQTSDELTCYRKLMLQGGCSWKTTWLIYIAVYHLHRWTLFKMAPYWCSYLTSVKYSSNCTFINPIHVDGWIGGWTHHAHSIFQPGDTPPRQLLCSIRPRQSLWLLE